MEGSFQNQPQARSQNVAVLGATGTIGVLTLEIARRYPDKINIVALSGGSNGEKLASQAVNYQPRFISLADPESVPGFKASVGRNWSGQILSGPDAATEIAVLSGIDVVVNGIVGAAGLKPSLATLEADRRLALANKESLVMAGSLMRRMLEDHPAASILPVDSEHSAIAQCLLGRGSDEVKSIILTASGGPFRLFDSAALARVTPAEALKHPTWEMGRRITIDSATLFNKGMELIEAHWLFNIPMERLGVLVHPQSLVHGLVETVDGSLIAQLSMPDMRLPIQLALSFPEHWGPAVPACSLARLGNLEFHEADEKRFPALSVARRAGKIGGVAPTVINGADEVLVEAFLTGEISFPEIAAGLSAALDQHQPVLDPSLTDILAADTWAREVASVYVTLHGQDNPGGEL